MSRNVDKNKQQQQQPRALLSRMPQNTSHGKTHPRTRDYFMRLSLIVPPVSCIFTINLR
jgi:hypothetical protein